MKDTPKISSLDIKCFRGLKNLKLDDLSNINIFVGGNNSGKTSVLEMIKLMSAPYYITMLQNVALQRISDSSKRRRNTIEYIRNMMVRDGDITAVEGYLIKADIICDGLNKNTLIIKAGIGEYLDDECDFGKTLNVEYFHNENSDDGQMYTIDDDGKVYDNNNSSRYPLYSAQYMYTTGDYYYKYIKMLSEYILNNGKNGVLSIVKKFDGSVSDIDILNDEIYLRNENSGISLPLYAYGAGMQKAVFMSIAVAYCRGGVILIDEVDNALNISAFRNVFSWFIKACIDNNVQAFITTHSAEALDEIISISQDNYAKDDILRVITLRKNPETGDSIAKINTGSQAYEFRSDYRMELRI